MSDTYPTVKVAAVQAASVFLDREASTAKACELIKEAGSKDARIIVLPESFIPGHPVWFHLHPATSELSVKLSIDLFKNAVEVPNSKTVDDLCNAARTAGRLLACAPEMSRFERCKRMHKILEDAS